MRSDHLLQAAAFVAVCLAGVLVYGDVVSRETVAWAAALVFGGGMVAVCVIGLIISLIINPPKADQNETVLYADGNEVNDSGE